MSRLYEAQETVKDAFECASVFRKEGRSMTVAVGFSESTKVLKIQQSVDGEKFLTIPDSETDVLDHKANMWMWNDSILPAGTFIRVAGEVSGTELLNIKVLTDS